MEKSNYPLRVAMIGTGHAHAKGIIDELKQYRKYESGILFEIVCYVDDAPNTEKDFNDVDFYTYDKFDAEWSTLGLSALIIETDMEQLIPTARKYLEICGLPMHIDKPTGYDDSFFDLMDRAKVKKVPISLGYMYRFNPAVIKTREILAEKVGKVFQVNCNMNYDGGNNTRKNMEKYPGGALYVYGSHMLDLVVSFSGKPDDIHVIKKSADTSISTGCDNGLVVLEYPNGTGVISVNLAAGNGYNQRGIVIYGDKGCVEIHPLELGAESSNDPDIMQISSRTGEQLAKKTSEKVNLFGSNFDRRYLYMMKNFAYLVAGDTDNIIFDCDYEYEKTLHGLLLKMIF